MRESAHAALALNGLQQHARGLRADQRLDRVEIAEGSLVEAVDLGAETVDIFLVSAGGDGRQRAPVKSALEGDEAITLGRAVGRVEFSRGLDRAFHRFGARIGEEHAIGECRVDETPRQPFGLRNLKKIGHVPGLFRRRAQGRDKMRMRMAERIHGDAAAKIEVTVAIGGEKPSALATFEGEIRARIGGK